jgi:hypothetical protein
MLSLVPPKYKAKAKLRMKVGEITVPKHMAT